MHTSQSGIDFIKAFEGYHRRLPNGDCAAYYDPVGVVTIGYGTTKGVKIGDVWTQEKATAFFAEDLKEYEGYVNSHNLSLTQPQYDMLVSFTYNCGPGSLNQLLTHKDIPGGILLFNRAAGRILPGLVRRRSEEAQIYRNGYAANMTSAVEKSTPKQIATEVKAASSKTTWFNRVYATVAGSTAAFFSADNLGIAAGAVDQIKTFATHNWVPLLCTAGVLIFVGKKWLEKKQVQDTLAGNYIPSGLEDVNAMAQQPTS